MKLDEMNINAKYAVIAVNVDICHWVTLKLGLFFNGFQLVGFRKSILVLEWFWHWIYLYAIMQKEKKRKKRTGSGTIDEKKDDAVEQR